MGLLEFNLRSAPPPSHRSLTTKLNERYKRQIDPTPYIYIYIYIYLVVSILICCRTRTPRNLSYKTWYMIYIYLAYHPQPQSKPKRQISLRRNQASRYKVVESASCLEILDSCAPPCPRMIARCWDRHSARTCRGMRRL